MGCLHTKVGRVQPVDGAAISIDNTDSDIETTDHGTQTKFGSSKVALECNLDSKGNKSKRKGKRENRKSPRKKHSLDSTESLDDNISTEGSDRGFSATSKSSQQSSDSGLGEDHYATIITEDSSKDVVDTVVHEFGQERELDLGITGTACPHRLSAKDKKRLEESTILQSLRDEGLISKPKAESAGGISFEIIANETSTAARPPPRLAKLEKKKKKVLTQDEIQEKLEKAEKRRKRKEEEKLEKIREKDKSDTLASLESFAQHQKEKEEQVFRKMDEVEDKRQHRLNEIRDRIKAKELHAEKVRQRKQRALELGETFCNEDSFDESF
ncbi:neurabin-1-like [Gigantopelta aegis]|uniref:neurabin-1-like n=1 Tax=Gigantopelta aegis TaxID=1735272 RepID=UPI001B88CEA2|nr:neurabin-1-like [Gigantopelta aegis]